MESPDSDKTPKASRHIILSSVTLGDSRPSTPLALSNVCRINEGLRIASPVQSPCSDSCISPGGVVLSGNGSPLLSTQHGQNLEKECLAALRWLRHTGFPHYAQQYESGEFPILIDAEKVAADHDWIKDCPDALQTLLDRLELLNQCACARVSCGEYDEESEEECTVAGTTPRRKTSPDISSQEYGGEDGDQEFQCENNEGGDPRSTGRRKTCVKLGRGNRVTGRPKAQYHMAISRNTSSLTEDEKPHIEPATSAAMHNQLPVTPEGNVDTILSASSDTSGIDTASPTTETTSDDRLYYTSADTTQTSTFGESTGTMEEEEEDLEELGDRGTAPSVARRHRWHSFNNRVPHMQRDRDSASSVAPAPTNLISTLSVSRMHMVRSVSLLKLTSQLECCIASHLPKNKRLKIISNLDNSRKKTFDYDRSSTLFGVPLDVLTKLNGHPLPIQIMSALDYIVLNGLETEGLFRVAGSSKRIKELKRRASVAEEAIDFSDVPIKDAASMVKEYFRDIPGQLFTSRITEAIVLIGAFVPEELQLQAIQHLMLIIPDENRETIFCILGFLNTVAQHSEQTKMDVHNLAVVFAPTLFHLTSPTELTPNIPGSPPVGRKMKAKKKADYDENSMAINVLSLMINRVDELHGVPMDTFMISLHTSNNPLDFTETVHIDDLGKDVDGDGDYMSYVEFCMIGMMKEHNSGYKNGWVPVSSPHTCEVSRKKVRDGHKLQLWRGVTDVAASPLDIQKRILRERSIWDSHLISATCIEQLDDQTEVFQYVCATTPSQPHRESVVLRSWLNRDDINIIMATSVRHPKAVRQSGVVITELATRYVIEPLGPNMSRLTLIVRHDLCGRSINFYKSYGPWSVSQVCRIRDSFLRPPLSSTSSIPQQ